MADQDTPRLMKDGLGPAAVARLREALQAADPGFDGAAFARRAQHGLATLELKERVNHLIHAMAAGLPADFEAALPVVLRAAAALPPPAVADKLGGFAGWPLIDWVPVAGRGHPDVALAALRRLTPLFSAEFAVRPFLLDDPQGALATLHGWIGDPDHHVRRLVSEGTRPRLPWGVQLPMFRADPAPVLVLLTDLRDDPSEYVRRSVANNLNDIAKDHPEAVLDTCESWWADGGAERRALVRHGLRTLIKRGDRRALGILGFTTRPRVRAVLALSTDSLDIGANLELDLQLESTGRSPQNLVVDYVVHHQRAGGRTTAKVFKWRTLTLAPGETVGLAKRHAFVPRSVRRLYPGAHRIEVLVGGEVAAAATFTLTIP